MRLWTLLLAAACGHEFELRAPETPLTVRPAMVALDAAGTCATSELYVRGDDVLTGVWLEPRTGDRDTLSWPAIHSASVTTGLSLALRYCAEGEPLDGTLVLTFGSGAVRTVWVGEE